MLTWTVHLEGGPRRVNHAAVAINERIYSFGGYCTGEDYENTRPMDVHVLNTVSLRWTLIPTVSAEDEQFGYIPYQRYGHSAVAYDDNAYIWGGRNDNDGACNRMFVFNTVTRRWLCIETDGQVPAARDGHSACIIGDSMYMFGGYEEESDRFSDDVYAFHFESKEWTYIVTRGQPAQWRDFHTAIGIDNIMYVFGGRSDRGGPIFTSNELYSSDIQTFDTDTKTWHEPVTEGDIPTGRRSHSVFSHEGCLYVFGGYNGLAGEHFKDIYRYNPAQCRWMKVKTKRQGPCARRRQCCCRIDSRVFLFGGTSPSSERQQEPGSDTDLMDLSDLHVLDLAPTLKTLAQMAVIDYKLDPTSLPLDIRVELTHMTTNNTISRSQNSNG